MLYFRLKITCVMKLQIQGNMMPYVITTSISRVYSLLHVTNSSRKVVLYYRFSLWQLSLFFQELIKSQNITLLVVTVIHVDTLFNVHRNVVEWHIPFMFGKYVEFVISN